MYLFGIGVPYDQVYEEDVDHDYTSDAGGAPHHNRKNDIQEEDAYYNRVIVKEYETVYRACDKKANLYILQQNLFIQGGNSLPSHGKSTCSR